MADQVPFPGPDATDAERETWQAYLATQRAKAAERERINRGYAGQFSVGDGITERIGSDAFPFTVIAVSPSGKTVTAREDKATLDPTWKPEFIPGGFVGHVSNQYTQRWTYEPNPGGRTVTVRLTKRGWAHQGTRFIPGRHRFHDYNF